MTRTASNLLGERPFLGNQGELLDSPAKGCRSLAFGEVREVNVERREVTAILSTPAVDRYEEVVLPSAYLKRLDRFKTNPVLCANHVYSAADGSPGVIGVWTEIEVRRVPGVGEALVGTCRFMEDDELAEKWWQRYRQGVAKAFSVGFLIHSYEVRSMQDEEGGKEKRVRTYTDVELIEVSAVTIPANPEAISLAVTASARGGVMPSSVLDPDTIGDDTAPSNRELRKQIARHVRPVVREVIGKELRPALREVLNTDPGGEMSNFIQDVIDAVRTSPVAEAYLSDDFGGKGFDDDLDDLDDLGDLVIDSKSTRTAAGKR